MVDGNRVADDGIGVLVVVVAAGKMADIDGAGDCLTARRALGWTRRLQSC